MSAAICYNLGDGQRQGWCAGQSGSFRFIEALAGKGPNDTALDEVRRAAAKEYGAEFLTAEYIGCIDAYGNCYPPCWGKEW